MSELDLIKNKKEKVRNLFIYFLIYAFLGWILESTYAFIIHKHFVNRGFLFGPLCPIYGFGAVMLIVLLQNAKGKPSKEFFIAAFAFTLFEYIVSFILEAAFGLRWWDYTGEFLNLQGRVSLAYSVIWGAMGILLIEWIHLWIESKIEKIRLHLNSKVQNAIIIIAILGIATDFIMSSANYLK